MIKSSFGSLVLKILVCVTVCWPNFTMNSVLGTAAFSSQTLLVFPNHLFCALALAYSKRERSHGRSIGDRVEKN
jgi:hypothetical protein